MDVSQRRPASPERKMEELEKQRQMFREALYKIDSVESELQGELWKEIKSRITAQLKTISDKRYQNGKEQAKYNLDILIGQEVMAIDILAIEEFVKSKPRFEEELGRVEHELRDLAKIARGGGSKS